MSQALLEINQDTIRELRRGGNWREANELLAAYRADVKKAGKRALLDARKHDRMKKKAFGICTQWGCENLPKDGHCICVSCTEDLRIRGKKLYHKRKEMEKIKKSWWRG